MANNRRRISLNKVLEESQDLVRYKTGETVESLACRLGCKPSEIIKLNSNENFFVPLDFLRGLLEEVVEEVDPRLYPGDETEKLGEALGRYVNASPEEIVVGTGSDQMIDLVSRFLRCGDEALSIAPTFSIYEQCTKIQGASYRAISLRSDFSLDAEKVLSCVTPKTKLLFLCSPNNPTANQFDRQEIARLIEDFPGFVVIDEAYVEFAKHSVIDLVKKSENIIVLRTFSKAFGLAGLRLGYAVTNQELASIILEKYQLPYSVSQIASKLGRKLLRNIEMIRSGVDQLKRNRAELVRALNQIEGVRAFDSETNFVLFEVDRSSDDVYGKLLEKGVLVKTIGRVLHLDNCLRATVAPSYMSERFLTCLEGVLGEKDV
jgi:histidinol-phosphate aminotransferase